MNLLFKPKSIPMPYCIEPVSASLFAPSNRYAEVTKNTEPRYRAYSRPRPDFVRLRRSERLEGYIPGLDPLSLVLKHESLECVGLRVAASPIEIDSEADTRDAEQAKRLLASVRLLQHNSRLRLLVPPHRKDWHQRSQMTVFCPSERSISVRVPRSPCGMLRVNARVQESIIDYSGQQGAVRLYAGWEISLRFTAQEFAGRLEAKSPEAIPVLVPDGFGTPMEASVNKGAFIVCRSGIQKQMRSREKGSRIIYRFGEVEPTIRLTSVQGPIVFDDAPQRAGQK